MIGKIVSVGAHGQSCLTVLVIWPRLCRIELICVHQNSQNRGINVQSTVRADKCVAKCGPYEGAAAYDECVGAVLIVNHLCPISVSFAKHYSQPMTLM